MIFCDCFKLVLNLVYFSWVRFSLVIGDAHTGLDRLTMVVMLFGTRKGGVWEGEVDDDNEEMALWVEEKKAEGRLLVKGKPEGREWLGQ